MTNDHILEFAHFLSEQNITKWIRHVLVPGITDHHNDLNHLVDFIGELTNIEKVEILPYHKLGVYKWGALGFEYPLKNIDPPSDEQIKAAYQILIKNGIS